MFLGEACPSYVERAKREELASVQVLLSGFSTMSSLHIYLENTRKVPLTYKCISIGALKRHFTRKERSSSEICSCLFGEACPSMWTERRKRRGRGGEGENIAIKERNLSRKFPQSALKNTHCSRIGLTPGQ